MGESDGSLAVVPERLVDIIGKVGVTTDLLLRSLTAAIGREVDIHPLGHDVVWPKADVVDMPPDDPASFGQSTIVAMSGTVDGYVFTSLDLCKGHKDGGRFLRCSTGTAWLSTGSGLILTPSDTDRLDNPPNRS